MSGHLCGSSQVWATTSPKPTSANGWPLSRGVTVLVVDDGSVLGYVHVYIDASLITGRRAQLGGLSVADGHRGRGVGETLLAGTEARGRQQDLPDDLGPLGKRAHTRAPLLPAMRVRPRQAPASRLGASEVTPSCSTPLRESVVVGSDVETAGCTDRLELPQQLLFGS